MDKRKGRKKDGEGRRDGRRREVRCVAMHCTTKLLMMIVCKVRKGEERKKEEMLEKRKKMERRRERRRKNMFEVRFGRKTIVAFMEKVNTNLSLAFKSWRTSHG